MYRGMYEGEKNEDFVERLAKELDEHFSRIGPDSVCAFIAETLPGSVCISYGFLLPIADHALTCSHTSR